MSKSNVWVSPEQHTHDFVFAISSYLRKAELAEMQNNYELAEQRRIECLEKFPEYGMSLAKADDKKKHFSSRF